MDTYDSVFFLSLGGILGALLQTTIKYCYKSKCEQFSICWGLFKIKRDIQAEEHIDMVETKEETDETKTNV